MFSFGATPEPDLNKDVNGRVEMDQPMPDDLEAVDASTKTTLLSAIDANQFSPRKEAWSFRRGYGTMEFTIQTGSAALLWIYCAMSVSASPVGRMDQEWLQTFALMFIIWSCIMHAAAYFPTPPCSVEAVRAGSRTGISYARENFSSYQWCLALIGFVVVLYPIMVFYGCFMSGFNPYSELSQTELQMENDTTGNLCYLLRVGLHTAFIILVLYMFVLLCAYTYIKNTRKFAGHHTWVAVRIGKLPLGAIFFYPGESFDCGICFEGSGLSMVQVVRCSCNQSHVFHATCLRSQIADDNNKFCVLCHTEITIAPKPE